MTTEREIVRDIKEKVYYVALDIEHFRCAEALFAPAPLG
jgi:hypothetical protein